MSSNAPNTYLKHLRKFPDVKLPRIYRNGVCNLDIGTILNSIGVPTLCNNENPEFSSDYDVRDFTRCNMYM